jgi:ribosome-associated translation inhibitor RaiA
MQIVVEGDTSFVPQETAYAEYRLFTALSRLGAAPTVIDARVRLERTTRPDGAERVSCSLTVTRHGAEEMRAHASGPHASAAVDRAIDRLARRTGKDEPLSV